MLWIIKIGEAGLTLVEILHCGQNNGSGDAINDGNPMEKRFDLFSNIFLFLLKSDNCKRVQTQRRVVEQTQVHSKKLNKS